MSYTVKSVIEMHTEGCAMLQHESSSSDAEMKEEKTDNSYRSEAKSNGQGFFHQVKSRHRGINQTTNVNVNIQQDDALTGCFKSIFKCLK